MSVEKITAFPVIHQDFTKEALVVYFQLVAIYEGERIQRVDSPIKIDFSQTSKAQATVILENEKEKFAKKVPELYNQLISRREKKQEIQDFLAEIREQEKLITEVEQPEEELE